MTTLAVTLAALALGQPYTWDWKLTVTDVVSKKILATYDVGGTGDHKIEPQVIPLGGAAHELDCSVRVSVVSEGRSASGYFARSQTANLDCIVRPTNLLMSVGAFRYQSFEFGPGRPMDTPGSELLLVGGLRLEPSSN